MTLDEALAALGSNRSNDLTTIRARYRRLVQRHHPDIAGESGQARTARLNAAWSIVKRTAPWPAVEAGSGSVAAQAGTAPGTGASARTGDPTTGGGGATPAPRLRDQSNVVSLPGPTRAVFDTLAEAADRLGDLSYVDRQDAIVETIIRPEGGPSCSLMLTLRQQGADTVAECVLESLEARPAPPIDAVVAQLVALLPEDWAEQARP